MIAVNNLSFKYSGSSRRAINDISFSVPKGEIIGFLGPSGAGKSTTQKILTGLLKRYTGTVRVMGKELSELGSDYYEKIGVSFELPNHYKKLTGLENLEFFRSLYSTKTEEPQKLLAMVGLEKDGKTRVSQYSKGMQMRLNFVRALLNNPEIVFMDEPTSGLDPVNAKNIKNIILNLKESGKTIFLTTHNMSVADELCDRVAFIVDGEISIIDSPRQLKLKLGKRIVKVEYQAGEKTDTKNFPLDQLGDNREFIELLRDKKIETIHTLEATLEDIFIKITGRSLK